MSLQPQEFDYKGIGLVVERDAGPDGRTQVHVSHIYDAHRGPAEIMVDGRTVASGVLDANETMEVPDEATPVVLRALVEGHHLHLSGGDEVSDTTLDGASAAFRYMDAQQGREDTVTALVAKGSRPASAVPTRPIPTIRAVRSMVAPPSLAPALKAELWSRTDCDGPVNQAFVKVYSLASDSTLVLVSCGMGGAYNNSQSPYVVRRGRAIVAPFDAPVGMGERGAPPSITSGDWNPKTAMLSSYERGRALGDCASQEAFVWDGDRFRLVERDELDQCRGGQTLLTLWRAKAAYTDAGPTKAGTR